VTELAKLLAKAEGYRPPLRLHESVRASLAGMAGAPELAPLEGVLRRAASGDAAAGEELARDPRFNAQLRTTFAPTLLRGGIRENVLPPDAEANLNVRLMPGERLDDFIRALMAHAGAGVYAVSEGSAKGKGDLEVVVADRGVEAPASPLDHEVYRALEAAARRLSPGAAVSPRLATGATDLRFFRAKGVAGYGIAPCPAGELEEGTPHHHDERVAVSSVSWGVGYVLEVLRDLGGLRPRR
jgi:carboxypeptidase PM20D1